MKIKTSELTGAALNWVVASIEWPNDTGVLNPELVSEEDINDNYTFADDAFTLVSLIEREKIQTTYIDGYGWGAIKHNPGAYQRVSITAPTYLEAVLRCHVYHHKGDEVEVPDHLL